MNLQVQTSSPTHRRFQSSLCPMRPCWTSLLWIQDHLSKLLALFQALMRGRGLAQRKALIDHSLQFTREDMAQDRVEIAHGSHKRSQEGELPRKKKAYIEVCLRPGGGSTGHQRSTGFERFHALLPGGLPHVFKDNVAHGTAGDFLYFFRDLLLVVIDHVIGAQLASFFHLCLVPGSGDDLRIEKLADLNGRRAHARSSSQYQHDVTRHQMAAIDQHVPGGHVHQWDRCRLIVGQFLGNRKHIRARNRNIFGIAAVVHVAEDRELRAKILSPVGAGRTVSTKSHRRKQYALPYLQIGDVFANFGNIAGNITAVDVRQLDSRQTLADEQIKMVQRAGFDLDQHLIFARLDIGHIFKFQNLRPAKLMETYGLHRDSLLSKKTNRECTMPYRFFTTRPGSGQKNLSIPFAMYPRPRGLSLGH